MPDSDRFGRRRADSHRTLGPSSVPDGTWDWAREEHQGSRARQLLWTLFLDDRERGYHVLAAQRGRLRILVLSPRTKAAHQLIVLAVGLTPFAGVFLVFHLLTGPRLAIGVPVVLVTAIFWLLGMVAVNSHIWNFMARRPLRTYAVHIRDFAECGPAAIRLLVDITLEGQAGPWAPSDLVVRGPPATLMAVIRQAGPSPYAAQGK